MISIVMPSKDRQTYLPEAIESVLHQTHEDFELIIVDDGSEDDSRILYDYYTAKDKRVKVMYIEPSGIAIARQTGVEASHGEFIAVMDSDDIMNPDRLKLSLKAIKGVDFVYSPYGLADESGEVKQWAGCPEKVTLEDVKNNASWPHVTIMARKKCFIENPYRPEFKVNDDSGLTWDWFKAGYKAKMIDTPTMIVRLHPQSTSNTKSKELKKVLDTLKKEYDEYEG
jgi:glycosyltransferase involved in cell wall biosynthesis